MATVDEQQEKTIGVPEGVPLSFDFEHSKVYVRDCYPKHFASIKGLLDSGQKYVSVTGTPGIGKSAFYLYFFQRYRREDPGAKVLTASFSKERQLEACVLWNANGTREKLERIPIEKACDLYLYDGPPDKKPPDGAKMIAFTSPNAGWFSVIDMKEPFHSKVYMPNWEFAELQEARDELDLDLDDKTLEDRFVLFGRAARFCLSQKEASVKKGKKFIMEAVSKIESFEQLQDCFKGNSSLELVVHRLMHYVPDANNHEEADLVPASTEISIMMHGRLQRKLDFERAKLAEWLDGVGKTSQFAAWLFENFVHELFLKGGVFEVKTLGKTPPEISQWKIDNTVGNYERFEMNFTLDQVFLDIYRLPESETQPSIDSYVLTSGVLYLFQITRNVHHPVGVEGLVTLLKKLGKFKDAKNGSLEIRLIFVVPTKMRDTFPKQAISHHDILTVPEENVLQQACIQVPGIGQSKKRKLDALDIKTVEQLLDPDNEDRTSFVRKAKEQLKENMKMMKEAEFLQSIDQYVIGVDYSEEKNACRSTELVTLPFPHDCSSKS